MNNYIIDDEMLNNMYEIYLLINNKYTIAKRFSKEEFTHIFRKDKDINQCTSELRTLNQWYLKDYKDKFDDNQYKILSGMVDSIDGSNQHIAFQLIYQVHKNT